MQDLATEAEVEGREQGSIPYNCGPSGTRLLAGFDNVKDVTAPGLAG